MMSMPKWVGAVIQSVCDSCICEETGRTSGFSARWSRPSENGWGTWLIDVAPEPLELVGGADDGDAIFDPVDADLIRLPRALDSVNEFFFSPGSPSEFPHLLMEGSKGGRDVVIRVWLCPFADDAPLIVYDVCAKRWRPKRW